MPPSRPCNTGQQHRTACLVDLNSTALPLHVIPELETPCSSSFERHELSRS
eukprot:m.33443 g.33443  ORF g.33443 m.33443 type:complete len:51 (+) comp10393_c0_seq1:1862-2014(+)